MLQNRPGADSGHVGGVGADPGSGDGLRGLEARGGGVDLVLGQGQVAEALVAAGRGRAGPRVARLAHPLQPLGGPHAGPGEGGHVRVLEHQTSGCAHYNITCNVHISLACDLTKVTEKAATRNTNLGNLRGPKDVAHGQNSPVPVMKEQHYVNITKQHKVHKNRYMSE